MLRRSMDDGSTPASDASAEPQREPADLGYNLLFRIDIPSFSVVGTNDAADERFGYPRLPVPVTDVLSAPNRRRFLELVEQSLRPGESWVTDVELNPRLDPPHRLRAAMTLTSRGTTRMVTVLAGDGSAAVLGSGEESVSPVGSDRPADMENLLPDRVATSMARTRDSELATSVFFMDFDDSSIDDDRIDQLGRAMRRALRPADTIARLQSDEFVVVCDVAGVDGARALASHLSERAEAELGGEFGAGSSPFLRVGVALDDQEADYSPGALLVQAQLALRRAGFDASSTPGTNIVVWSPSLSPKQEVPPKQEVSTNQAMSSRVPIDNSHESETIDADPVDVTDDIIDITSPADSISVRRQRLDETPVATAVRRRVPLADRTRQGAPVTRSAPVTKCAPSTGGMVRRRLHTDAGPSNATESRHDPFAPVVPFSIGQNLQDLIAAGWGPIEPTVDLGPSASEFGDRTAEPRVISVSVPITSGDMATSARDLIAASERVDDTAVPIYAKASPLQVVALLDSLVAELAATSRPQNAIGVEIPATTMRSLGFEDIEHLRALRRDGLTIMISDLDPGSFHESFLDASAARVVTVAVDSVTTGRLGQLLAIASQANVAVIADGVGRRDQLDVVHQAHCRYARGPLFRFET